MRDALTRAADQAYAAVGRPVEGTMLSVARAAAEGGAAGRTLAEVLQTAVEAARSAVRRTPRQAAALASAGVVDAGGSGLVVVLEALRDVVRGDPAPEPDPVERADPETPEATGGPHAPAVGYAGPGTEVMFLLDADEPAVAALRARLAEPGRRRRGRGRRRAVERARAHRRRRRRARCGRGCGPAARGAGHHPRACRRGLRPRVRGSDAGAARRAGSTA
ncbi:hypothetical protein GCM10025868_40310 [Angustibacter aerolatus]|uniref:DhaL domain-containing protein n=1 Tax=Angustibacter aerolatus TaxID=1162965 RepID=A0ABQ6JKJ8_9ACTN|nr:hypothetical protein GCM10025868_40310 [Angustibacter aerolatus]